MFLITGLGNPGSAYRSNRHNVGFLAVDEIARKFNFPAFRSKYEGLASEGVIGDHRVLLLKPQTYMNESGRSVGQALRFLKLDLARLIVLHDELDLAAGKLRVKTGGGNAGHNGLRSITGLVGNEYKRVRIGIGHPGDKALVHAYVLSNFDRADIAWVGPMLEAIAAHAGTLLAGADALFQTQIDRAMRQSLKA
ncbi:MAG: aminoacyl-tRNA hydrolase [Hyphomicrobiales bacterium]|nr:aminoacyl-tRNA hydrolase [Hyphomicrobiales bacterium]MDE2113634.1 aminoacyl-tRNA hydrolase [Hyphomicrobiales bacterium]